MRPSSTPVAALAPSPAPALAVASALVLAAMLAVTPAAMAVAAPAAGATGAAVAPFDPSKYSQAVTDCDRLAAHPEDPHKVQPGLDRGAIDLPKAITACEAAVKAEPANPRLNYQLARVYGYSGQGEKAIPYRKAATDADYPQALFVVGFITLNGMNRQPQDTCAGAELIRRSALQGRLAGLVGFPHWALAGRFDACPVRRDPVEMAGFLEAARKQVGTDFYQGLLVESLQRELRARAASP